MLNVVSDIITASLNQQNYADILRGVNAELENGFGSAEGVLEFSYPEFELVFWYCVSADESDVLLKRWMILTFNGGIRCSNDFDLQELLKLSRWKR